MQIFHFSNQVTLILCFTLWPLLQILAMYISYKLPSKFFNPNKYIFQSFKFEQNGKIYKTIFKVQKWKKYLPDGAAVRKAGYRKKHIADFTNVNLEIFLQESCRAEFGHILAIFPFFVFGLFLPLPGLLFMFLYAFIVNLPCIIAQRFNRPRVSKLLAVKKGGKNV